MKEIGTVFRERRQKLKWTIKETASTIGIYPNQYYKYERNENIPNAYIFLDICKGLGLSFDDFA